MLILSHRIRIRFRNTVCAYDKWSRNRPCLFESCAVDFVIDPLYHYKLSAASALPHACPIASRAA